MQKSLMFVAAAALAAPVMLPVAVQAQSAEDVAEARISYQRLLSFEMGPLAAMVRGDAEYDAERAQAHADNLVLLSQYDQTDLLRPGTSKADLPGKTRAEPAIWDDLEAYFAAEQAFTDAALAVQAAAGAGLNDLRPLFADLGGSCRGCHSDYRAEDF